MPVSSAVDHDGPLMVGCSISKLSRLNIGRGAKQKTKIHWNEMSSLEAPPRVWDGPSFHFPSPVNSHSAFLITTFYWGLLFFRVRTTRNTDINLVFICFILSLSFFMFICKLNMLAVIVKSVIRRQRQTLDKVTVRLIPLFGKCHFSILICDQIQLS